MGGKGVKDIMAFWTVGTVPLPGGEMQSSFEMDSLADVADLPPLSKNVAAGSDAFSVLEKRLVMLGSDGVWK